MPRWLPLLGLVALEIALFHAADVRAEANASSRPAPAAALNDAIVKRFSGNPSDLERRLFDDAEDGRLDFFSPLDAALIASGEDKFPRLRHYEEKLAAWIAELRSSIAPNDLAEKNAERVFDFLHRRALRGGYRLECTDLRAAFDEGRYNCVSASVLFNGLAEGVGLNCKGLEAPGHAASRVFLPQGPLDLETTCPRWFEILRDPAKRDEVGLESGRLSKCDRSQIREVTPIQMAAMIYYNRGVDYLNEKRFAEAAAVNAKSLRLDPENATAKGNFLATLNNWSIELCGSGRFAEAVELNETGAAFDPHYPPLHRNFAYLYRKWCDALCGEGKFSEAIDLLRRAGADASEKEEMLRSISEFQRLRPPTGK
jgi:tetratricopeptide (TPR) repeat protein